MVRLCFQTRMSTPTSSRRTANGSQWALWAMAFLLSKSWKGVSRSIFKTQKVTNLKEWHVRLLSNTFLSGTEAVSLRFSRSMTVLTSSLSSTRGITIQSPTCLCQLCRSMANCSRKASWWWKCCRQAPSHWWCRTWINSSLRANRSRLFWTMTSAWPVAKLLIRRITKVSSYILAMKDSTFSVSKISWTKTSSLTPLRTSQYAFPC